MPHYSAFLSYVHGEHTYALDRLQRGISRLAVSFHKLRGRRVFRDRTALRARPDLWKSIAEALENTDYLVLCATPEAAESEWVAREVSHFLDSGRSLENIIIVLLDGEISWSQKESDSICSFTGNALPRILVDLYESEPLYIDLRWMIGKKQLTRQENQTLLSSVASIVAQIENLEKDEVWGTDIRYRQNAFGALTVTALALVGLAGGLYYAFNLASRNAAEAERQAAIATQNEARAEEQAQLARDNETEANRQRNIAVANEEEARQQANEALAASLRNRAQLAWQTGGGYEAGTVAKLAATAHFLLPTPESSRLIQQAMYVVAPETEEFLQTFEQTDSEERLGQNMNSIVVHSVDGGNFGSLFVDERFDDIDEDTFSFSVDDEKKVSVRLRFWNRELEEWRDYDLSEILLPEVETFGILAFINHFGGPLAKTAHLSTDGRTLAMCFSKDRDEEGFVRLLEIELEPAVKVRTNLEVPFDGLFEGCDHSFATGTFLAKSVFSTDGRYLLSADGKTFSIEIPLDSGFASGSSLSPNGESLVVAWQGSGAHLLLFQRSGSNRFDYASRLSLPGSSFSPNSLGPEEVDSDVRVETTFGDIVWSANSEFFTVSEQDTGFGFVRIGLYQTSERKIEHIKSDRGNDPVTSRVLWVSQSGDTALIIDQGQGMRLRSLVRGKDIFVLSSPRARYGTMTSDKKLLLYQTFDGLFAIDAHTTPGFSKPVERFSRGFFRRDLTHPHLALTGEKDISQTPFEDQRGATLWDSEASEWYQIDLESGSGEVFDIEFSDDGGIAFISFNPTWENRVICLANVKLRQCIYKARDVQFDRSLARTVRRHITKDGTFAFFLSEGDPSYRDDADERDVVTIIRKTESSMDWVQELRLPLEQNVLGASLVDNSSIILVTGSDAGLWGSKEPTALVLWRIALSNDFNSLELERIGVIVEEAQSTQIPISENSFDGKIILGVVKEKIEDENVGYELLAVDLLSATTEVLAYTENLTSVEFGPKGQYVMIQSSPSDYMGWNIDESLSGILGASRIEILRRDDGERVFARDFEGGFNTAYLLLDAKSLRVVGLNGEESTEIDDYLWQPDAMIEVVCWYLGDGLTEQYWRANISNNIPLVNVCN
ncbi:TIR domain-containing protein [Leisingera caerulea]|uniref:TIR domain-containing protein n=1 Tax=Leisingera caerulea TaxID=506591 RepID=UPI0021A32F9C|nr:TIR domain-containing protein [Leisingera caerulea]UWQ83115.1 TIR domain-containing protein [Leisingera caerulea]